MLRSSATTLGLFFVVSSAAAEGGPFEIESGSCTIDDSGCVLSPNYPSDYTNNQNCVIKVLETVKLDVVAFHTEMCGCGCCDPLCVITMDNPNPAPAIDISSVCFEGPQDSSSLVQLDGLTVSPSEYLYWYSDGSTPESGFKICPPAPATNSLFLWLSLLFGWSW